MSGKKAVLGLAVIGFAAAAWAGQAFADGCKKSCPHRARCHGKAKAGHPGRAALGAAAKADRPARAGNAEAGARNQRPRRGGGRRWDPARMRQRFLERIQGQLGLKDAEWQDLKPRVEKVLKARTQTMTMRGWRRRRNQEGEAPPKLTDLQQKAKALREILEDNNAKPEAIEATLKAFREARDKAKKALTKAQEQLRAALNAREEALLVLWGMLD